MIGTVYRPSARNANGDPVDDDGNVIRVKDGLNLAGTINGIVMGGQSVAPSRGRQESSDTTGQIGCPNTESVKLRFGDRIVIDTVSYNVTSRPEWDYPSNLTGSSFGFYWCHVVATVG